MNARTSILMYHSISRNGGATAIAPEVFAMQMATLSESGVAVLSLDQWLAARVGDCLPARSAVITFDDGFADFEIAAWPVMKLLGLRPIVYLPTGFVGRSEGWKGIGSPPRALMGWSSVRSLADEGVLFGSHTVSHPDLNRLSLEQVDEELRVARHAIEDHIGQPVRHFAPPYGLANARVRKRIGKYYDTSVGTRLGEAGARAELLDLPRIEMFYYTDPSRWRAYLAGRGDAYLAVRKGLRAIKSALVNPWKGI